MATGWRENIGKRKIAPRPCHLSADEIRNLFSYDPATGVITNKVTRGPATAGAQAGTLQRTGYRRIAVCGRNYKAHHVAWMIHHGEWPVAIIDHINRDRDDNRIANLRLASASLNNHNRTSRNASGFPGVSKNRLRFQSFITVDGAERYLGTYRTPQEAHAAYAAAKQQIFATN